MLICSRTWKMEISGVVDLSQRPVDKQEIIDRPDISGRVAEASYSFMEEVNRFYGGRRAITSFLESEIETGKFKDKDSLRILDLGAGGCDIPAAVVEWGKKENIDISYTCLEQHPAAIRRARMKNRLDKIRLLREDFLDYKPDRQYDYVTASMVFHHFSLARIRQIIGRYSASVREAIVINDLFRHRVLYWLTWLRTLITTKENRHDALLSVRKGFHRQELKNISKKIPGGTVKVERLPLFRLRAVFRFERS